MGNKKQSKSSQENISDTTTKESSEHKSLSAEERIKMISEAAYYRAEKRGFSPDKQTEDWLMSESKIDELYGEHA